MRYPCSPLRPTRIFYYFTFFCLLVLLTTAPTPHAAEPFLRDWQPLGPGPRQNATVIEFKDKIWLLGGKTPTYTGTTYFNDVWTCTSFTDWWRVNPRAPFSPRADAKAIVYKDQLWIFSGSNATGTCSDLWITPDGIHWTSQTLATLNISLDNLQVFRLDGKLALANRNVVVSTEDGLHWTTLVTMTFNSGFFCINEHAVFYFGNHSGPFLYAYRYTAETGWVEVGSYYVRYNPPVSDFVGQSLTLNGISYFYTRNGQLYSTTDGFTWQSLGGYMPYGMTTSNHSLLAYRGQLLKTDGFTQAWSSTDGSNWQWASTGLPAFGMSSMNYAQNDRGQTLAVVRQDAKNWYSFFSNDGRQWQFRGMLTSAQYEIPALVWFNGAFYLFGTNESNLVRRSTDGIAWEDVAALPIAHFTDDPYPFAFHEELFYPGVNSTYQRLLYHSLDGTLWAETQIPFPFLTSYNLWQVPLVFNDRIWVLFRPDIIAASLHSSADAINWTTHTLPNNRPAWASLAAVQNKLVLVTPLNIYTSSDGSNWQTHVLPPVRFLISYYCLPAANGLYLYGGMDDELFEMPRVWFTPFQANAAAPAWNLYP